MQTITPDQARALTSIAIFAAFADGGQSDAERTKVKEVVEGLGIPGTTEAFRRVVMKQTTVDDEARHLDSEELRLLAWEGALSVCESDGATTDKERRFLDDLAVALERSLDVAHREVAEADQMAEFATSDRAPTTLPVLATSDAMPPVTAAAATRSVAAPAAVDPRAAQVDQSVLRYSILTAAIELLPQDLATLAIIPLQTKMVHSVGTTYGYSLSASSIKEFVATIGIGMTGQVLEQYARKFLKKVGKGLLGNIGKFGAAWATGPAMTFATTYAIGMVAKQYYAGGRTLSAIDLKTLFASEVERAKGLYEKYEPQVRNTAANTSASQVLASLRQ
jgi:uncharacterized protein (DUF697 family)/tellurite resistance protein